jgi:hypothetical protein
VLFLLAVSHLRPNPTLSHLPYEEQYPQRCRLELRRYVRKWIDFGLSPLAYLYNSADAPSAAHRTVTVLASAAPSAAHRTVTVLASPDGKEGGVLRRKGRCTVGNGEPTQDPWRVFARQANVEKNPEKMLALVKKLIEAYDGSRPQRRKPRSVDQGFEDRAC